MAAFNSISTTQLLRRIGTPDGPVLVDVRIDEDFRDFPNLIPTSFRWPHADIAQLSSALSGHQAVLICQKGLKLSHGAAAVLRCDGIDAQVLEGGMTAWQSEKLPTIPEAVLPPRLAEGSLWVTRHRPKIDRIACAWLIRRFVDPRARFLFVPAAEVGDVSARFNAVSFDTPGAHWTHEGELCTFDSMIAGFGLDIPALQKLATLVRAADTDRLELAPEAAGLLAVSVGLSRMHKSDLQQLEAGMTLYDALYRWARDGQNETHNWPEKHGK